MKLSARRPSPSMLVAVIALVMAMSGAAVALPGKGKVKSNDIAKGVVKSKHIAKNAVRSKQVLGKSLKGNDLRDQTIKSKQIADDAVTGQQVATDSLDDSDIADYEALALARVEATGGATAAAARTAAPETALFTKGPFTVYAKCFRDTAAGETTGEIYARTSADDAILQGADNLPDNDATLLDADTPEVDAVVDDQTVADPDAGTIGEAENVLISGDGATSLHYLSYIGVKQGTFADGNGAFGEGNACVFGGTVTG